MNQAEFLAHKRAVDLQLRSDRLFAACLHFLIDKDERWLTTIIKTSQELLDRGYETSFEHKKKALIVRSLFSALELRIVEAPDDRLQPRLSDLESLPDAEIQVQAEEPQFTVGVALRGREEL